MQAFVTLGYNSIPLPGGVGAYEYLFLRIYALSFEQAFVLSAMMVTRAISYYLSLIVSGVYTLTYHIVLMKKTRGGDAENERSDDGSVLPTVEKSVSNEENKDALSPEEGKTEISTDETGEGNKQAKALSEEEKN